MLIGRKGPGNRDEARELLTGAIAMYRRIGMPKHVDMAEALLGEVQALSIPVSRNRERPRRADPVSIVRGWTAGWDSNARLPD